MRAPFIHDMPEKHGVTCIFGRLEFAENLDSLRLMELAREALPDDVAALKAALAAERARNPQSRLSWRSLARRLRKTWR